MDVINILEQAGLNKKEADVYLASLKLGPASISDLAKQAKIKRPSLYLVMDGMLEKKLIHKTLGKKRILYYAENPESIKRNLKEKLEKVEGIIPELALLHQNSPSRPKVRFYEGKEGIKKIYEEIAVSSANIITCCSIDNFFQNFTENESAYLHKLIKESGSRIDDILEDTEIAREYAKKEYRKGVSRTKFLSSDFKLSTDTLVFGSNVAFISFPSLIGVVVENEEIASTQRNFLKFLWKKL